MYCASIHNSRLVNIICNSTLCLPFLTGHLTCEPHPLSEMAEKDSRGGSNTRPKTSKLFSYSLLDMKDDVDEVGLALKRKKTLNNMINYSQM